MADEDSFVLLFMLNVMIFWIERQVAQGRMLLQWLSKRRRMRQRILAGQKHPSNSHIGILPTRNGTFERTRRTLSFKYDHGRPSIIRRLWVKPRPKLWWNRFTDCQDDVEWRKHFRMSRGSFEFLVETVRPYLQRELTRFRQPIAVRKRVAVALWRLATGCDYRTVQELFGLGKSTSCMIFQEFVTAVAISLRERFLHHPTTEEIREIVQGFRDVWGFPQCLGAIDGTHVPVQAPTQHRNDYFNRKGWYSVICQAICDHRGLFWDIDVGWPGKVHDARVFSNSSVYHLGQAGQLFPDITERFGAVDVPLCIVGDPAYPLQPWLLKPYRETPDTPEIERHFNYRLSRARMVIECAFGRLKGRWRCLLKRNDTHIALVPNVVLCCAILHNICEKRGELFDGEDAPVRDLVQPRRQVRHDDTRGEIMARAQAIRDALCSHLSSNRF